MKTSRILTALSLAFVLIGFFFSFWPFFIAALLFLAVARHFFIVFFLGVLLDLIFGKPVGMLALLFFPFTVFSALLVAVFHFLGKNWVIKDIERL